ncbi:hypothetical protein SAMN02745157_0971 [Kaistia soli DSM 19436]|uniref:Vitamin K epoxide reductase family protein n=1 Tax=Kaistia soli DSM 19436 TaxID=1122133 RepID=A0A1M4WGW7_9HYPH|nr:hypothetical protein [Kaistia soli]SHE80313.1 hypothetical protein SAMN02745157_0971 [Kaistia soli DSM 19436]
MRPHLTSDRTGTLALSFGLLALLVALAWWTIIYSQVIGGDYMSVPAALPCLANVTDTCSLAQALCKGSHFLGIRRYSPELLWAAAGLLAVGALLRLKRD